MQYTLGFILHVFSHAKLIWSVHPRTKNWSICVSATCAPSFGNSGRWIEKIKRHRRRRDRRISWRKHVGLKKSGMREAVSKLVPPHISSNPFPSNWTCQRSRLTTRLCWILCWSMHSKIFIFKWTINKIRKW